MDLKVLYKTVTPKGVLWWKKYVTHTELVTYRGSATVWHSLKDGSRPEGYIEGLLSDRAWLIEEGLTNNDTIEVEEHHNLGWL